MAARPYDTAFFGHPRGLSTLFFTEMWERFSYYGMRALLILFMTADPATGGLGFDAVTAGAIYGLYTSMVYMFTLPGGWVADQILGPQRAVLIGGVLIAAGHFSMAVPALAAFYAGLALIVVGAVYRTPFPVQPMKAIGAAAIAPSAQGLLTASTVAGAGLVTGLIWLILGSTGLVQRLARWVPRPALLGVILGLGFGFMLEGIRMMATSPWLSGALLACTLLLLSRPLFPAMLGLLVAGFGIALGEQPTLWSELAAVRLSPRLPEFTWPSLSWHDLWLGSILLALPQLPLTFGNALLAIQEENNRLFPQHAVSQRKVAISTGLLNIWSSAIGAIPMCHGAGGMAGHVRFGATTGGASIMLGVLLTAIALLLGDSIATLLRVFPHSVLGVILFLAGAELALGSREPGSDKVDRFVILATAALAVWNVGIAVIFGILAHHASKRGWLKI